MKKFKIMNNKILTHNGYLNLIIGNTYKGLGYCGMSEGIEIIGKLIEYDRGKDHSLLLTKNGLFHAVILTSLIEI